MINSLIDVATTNLELQRSYIDGNKVHTEIKRKIAELRVYDNEELINSLR